MRVYFHSTNPTAIDRIVKAVKNRIDLLDVHRITPIHYKEWTMNFKAVQHGWDIKVNKVRLTHKEFVGGKYIEIDVESKTVTSNGFDGVPLEQIAEVIEMSPTRY